MGISIRLKAADGFSFGAYEAKPDGKARGALVVIQEIFGVNDHIRRVAEGYVADGFHVIAPQLFDRAEPIIELGYEKPDMDRGIALRASIPTEATLADIQATVDRLKGAGKVGMVGYCWGGSMAWLGAAHVNGLAATVGYYGGMIAKNLDAKPRVPVMLHFGETDTGIPMSDVEKVKAAADPAKVQIFTYPAGHAFNRDGNKAFNAHCAMLARERTLKFLAQHIG
jgi:carboxymethylenebutenolidase